MANTLQLKNDIKKLKGALASKGLSASIKDKLRNQLKKAENELKSAKAGAAPRKVSTTKSTKSTLQSLKELVKKKKYGVYKNAGVDLEKDADEGAMAVGRRVSKGLKSNQFGSKKENKGNVYYEYRANRLDVKQPKGKQKYPKLADGGALDGYKDLSNVNPSKIEVSETTAYGTPDRLILKSDGKKIAEFYYNIKGYNRDFVLKNNEGGSYIFGQEKPKTSQINEFKRALKAGYTNLKYYNEFEEGGYMAKGGELEYDSILSVLKEKIEDAVQDLPRDYETADDFKGEEVEHESRDGFIAYTDGGFEATWFDYISRLKSTGYGLPTAGLDAEMERQADYNYEAAKDRFKDEYPEIVEELGEDNIDYHSLQDAGYDSEAEELSEWEMDFNGEDTIMMQIGAFYYTPENSRGQDGKHTIFVFSNVNLESPYHRTGNLDDGIDFTFTFNSIDDLKKKMDVNLKKITDWFGGKNYNEGKKELRVTRMAKGGKTKDEPKIIRGYFEDEAFEYADGGLVVKSDEDLHEIAKYMAKMVKKHRWDFKDLVYYFEKDNNYDYNYRTKIWDEMNVYEMKKSEENIYKVLKAIKDANESGKMAEGGVTEQEVVDSNALMVLSQIKAVKHHADELSKIVTKKSDLEAWVIAKIERASTDLSDITHYLDGQHEKMSMGGGVYHYAHKMDKK
jgi:hypothetical protein